MAKQPKKPVDAAEAAKDKRAAFLKLGEKRMTKAIKAIRLLGNLSGRNYAPTADDIVKMQTALNDAVKSTMARFAPGGAAKETEFKFQ